MRKHSDLFDTALAAAALAGAVQLSPWLNRALESTHEAEPPRSLQASHTDSHEACDQRGAGIPHTTCAALQKDRGNGVVTAGADKTF